MLSTENGRCVDISMFWVAGPLGRLDSRAVWRTHRAIREVNIEVRFQTFSLNMLKNHFLDSRRGMCPSVTAGLLRLCGGRANTYNRALSAIPTYHPT